jgi:transcriptional regulator with XRE-family HTH domain
MTYMTGLDERIRQARRASGLTQEALAERIGVPPTALEEYEDGGAVSERHVKRIAVATGMPLSFFRDGVLPEAPGGEGLGLRARIRAALDWLAEPSGPDGVAALLAEVAERERALEDRERRLAEQESALAAREAELGARAKSPARQDHTADA